MLRALRMLGYMPSRSSMRWQWKSVFAPAKFLTRSKKTVQYAAGSVEEQAAHASVAGVETAIEYGSPYRAIRSYVDEYDIGLVVMGTHGRSGIERYLLGSITEKTVRTSPVPVITVRQTG